MAKSNLPCKKSSNGDVSDLHSNSIKAATAFEISVNLISCAVSI